MYITHTYYHVFIHTYKMYIYTYHHTHIDKHTQIRICTHDIPHDTTDICYGARIAITLTKRTGTRVFSVILWCFRHSDHEVGVGVSR